MGEFSLLKDEVLSLILPELVLLRYALIASLYTSCERDRKPMIKNLPNDALLTYASIIYIPTMLHFSPMRVFSPILLSYVNP